MDVIHTTIILFQVSCSLFFSPSTLSSMAFIFFSLNIFLFVFTLGACKKKKKTNQGCYLLKTRFLFRALFKIFFQFFY